MFISFQLAKASQTQENLYYLIKIFNCINSSLFSAFTASRTPKEQQQGAFSCPTARSGYHVKPTHPPSAAVVPMVALTQLFPRARSFSRASLIPAASNRWERSSCT